MMQEELPQTDREHHKGVQGTSQRTCLQDLKLCRFLIVHCPVYIGHRTLS